MSKKPLTKTASPVFKSVKTVPDGTFDKWEKYLEKKKLRLLLILPLVLGTFFVALTFDIKISEGNDDAMYIEAATKYAADFTGYYYTANAPMYPMMLGIVTMISGFNLTLYKLISALLFLAHLALMYFAFRRRVPYTVLFPVLLFSSVNSYFLYYASQTYTEMLFVTLQALFFMVFFKWQEAFLKTSGSINSNDAMPAIQAATQNASLISRLKGVLAIGIIMFLLTFSKNIAIGSLGAILLFFIIQRNWKSLADAVAGYVLIRLSFEGIKAAIWGASNQYGSQGAILLQKDAYNPAAGNEDINGFITRFFENFNLYTGKRLYQILGFKDPDSNQAHVILSLLALALVLFAAWRIYVEIKKASAIKSAARLSSVTGKKQTTEELSSMSSKHSVNTSTIRYANNVLFVLIYILTLLFMTYLVLQTRWDQPRLIMVYVPLLLMVIFYGFYTYLHNSGALGRMGYLALVVLIVGSSLLTTVKKSIANYPVLKKNLQGDLYYGYTPDWENFLRLSAWCADSLPQGSFVASRKAPMSFVYAKGMPFFPVYTVPALDTVTNMSHADSVLALFKQNKVTHVLLGSLRRNPNKPDGYIINTLHRMLQPVAQQYPQKVKLVKQIGETEPAYLYEIGE